MTCKYQYRQVFFAKNSQSQGKTRKPLCSHRLQWEICYQLPVIICHARCQISREYPSCRPNSHPQYIRDKYMIGQFDVHMNINIVTPDIESLVVKISLRIDYCYARPFGSALLKLKYFFHFKVYYSLLCIIK